MFSKAHVTRASYKQKRVSLQRSSQIDVQTNRKTDKTTTYRLQINFWPIYDRSVDSKFYGCFLFCLIQQHVSGFFGNVLNYNCNLKFLLFTAVFSIVCLIISWQNSILLLNMLCLKYKMSHTGSILGKYLPPDGVWSCD